MLKTLGFNSENPLDFEQKVFQSKNKLLNTGDDTSKKSRKHGEPQGPESHNSQSHRPEPQASPLSLSQAASRKPTPPMTK